MGLFDLHMHSTISRDGSYTPEELIQIAKKQGLKVVALSDHNDMKGIDRMIEAGKKENIQVIPAIEFDTLFEGLEVHLLGYNFDYNKPYYQNLGFNNELCPVCEEFYKKELSIPMYPTLTDEDIQFVKDKLYKVISEFD